MTDVIKRFLSVATVATLALVPRPTVAEVPAPEAPLSVIDWLGTQPQLPGLHSAALPRPDEPPVARTATAPQISVAPLQSDAPRSIGLVPGEITGLPDDLWAGSDVADLIKLISGLPNMVLPAAQSLLFTVLLAETQAPQGGKGSGDALALARVERLMKEGALDPALSLIEQAGVRTSAAHFDLWMQISLLSGTEDRACDVLRGAPYLTQVYGTRIFCAARDQRWDNAALTFGSAQALGLMPEEKLALLDRFLHPESFEGAAPLPSPRDMDPLSFRLFEAIGEPMPTRNLPRAFAVADLRDVAGWKSQLEAAERLTRAGALPDNRLLGLYTDREPAASGGIWDRVQALQQFETALGTGSAQAVAKTLPNVWQAMQEAELEVAFAGLFASRLAEIPLEGRSARVAFEVGLLSAGYETVATSAKPGGDTLGPDSALLIALAQGETPPDRPDGALSGAIYDAFDGAAPRSDMMEEAQQKKLGEVILRTLRMLDTGARGDTNAMRDALATLRALGLEDTARRAALQTLLLER